MKNILVPIYSIENGINNLRYATSLAALYNARIYVTCIKSLGMELILREVLENTNTQDVQVISKPISGDIFTGISGLCNKMNIDFMILTPQSVHIKDEIYLGKVTTKIIKQTKIPLLIVPPNYLFRRFESIMFAYKNVNITSKSSIEMLGYFVEYFNATLHILRVVTPDTVENDRVLQPELTRIMNSFKLVEKASVFQGIVSQFSEVNPELLCVLRRRNKKEGFFRKLLRQNEVIKKKQFFTTKPLLILKEHE